MDQFYFPCLYFRFRPDRHIHLRGGLRDHQRGRDAERVRPLGKVPDRDQHPPRRLQLQHQLRLLLRGRGLQGVSFNHVEDDRVFPLDQEGAAATGNSRDIGYQEESGTTNIIRSILSLHVV